MDNVLDHVLERFDVLESARRPWEQHWEDIARYVAPAMSLHDIYHKIEGEASEPYASYRAPEIYDHTSLMAIDRLAAGELSLVMPSSQIWHTLKSNDIYGREPSDAEERWYDDLTHYLFRMRYNPKTGFQSASKAAIKCRAGFGTSVMYIEEAMGRDASAPVSYRYIPILENHLATNFEGVVDTNYRIFQRTPRQCVQRWGDKCSDKVKKAADDPKEQDSSVIIIHAVEPVKDAAPGSPQRFRSVYVEKDNKHVIGKGGYRSFPYIVFHWNRESQGPYCEGPVSIAISEIKSVNMLSKQEYIATQQWVNPPTAQRDDGPNVPNLNPGAPNPGMLDEAGNLLIKPIVTVQRPDFARQIVEAKQGQLRESLYVNLWQILINNPQMTATEALIRAQEKGDLLGPTGLSLQDGLSNMVDREFSILESKGMFGANSPMAPPEEMQGRSFGATFTGPLDKLRRASEVVGMQRVLEMATIALQMAASAGKTRKVDEIIERFDFDEILDITQDVNGAPEKMFKDRERYEQDMAVNEQVQRLMAAVQGAQAGGDAAKSVGEGVSALQAAGNPPQQ